MSATKKELLKVVQAKCLDCVAYQKKEVELCPSNDCALWPFRLGKDPCRTPLTAAQKAARMKGLEKARTAKMMLTQA